MMLSILSVISIMPLFQVNLKYTMIIRDSSILILLNLNIWCFTFIMFYFIVYIPLNTKGSQE